MPGILDTYLVTSRRFARRTVLALAGAAAVAACTPAPVVTESPTPSAEPTPNPTPRGAPLTGTLAVYSAIDDRTTTELLAAFTKTFPGVRAEALAYALPDELETRIRIEKQFRKADVILGGASAHHDILGRDGFLEAYVSAPAAQIGARLKEPTGLWTGWYEDVLGLVVHQPRIAREFGGKRPATWDDLLDPAWTGKIVVPDPALTDAGFAFLATQYFRLDRDDTKMLDYLKALNANVLRYPRDQAAAVSMIAGGEAVGAVAWGHDVLADAVRRPATELLAPKDTSLEIGAVSIVKGTVSGAAARALVDWLVGRDAQATVATFGGRSPAQALAAPPAGSPPLSSLDPSRYDRRAAYDLRGRLIGRWRTAAGV
jgi:iron(III) transport system substrate-binding protein